jgi:Ca2+-transporting ATPase
MHILTSDVVVGDVVLLQTGDVIAADGVLITGFDVEIDESTMTGF